MLNHEIEASRSCTVDQALQLAAMIVADDPDTYSNHYLYGDMNLHACAVAVLSSHKTDNTPAVALARAVLVEDCDHVTPNAWDNESYIVYQDGSVMTCLQADDYCYADLQDFYADFPDAEDAE